MPPVWINSIMKKVLIEYFYIFSVGIGLLTLALIMFPDKQNQLEFIEKRIEDVKLQRDILTEKEKQLEKLANEKDWEEVDNDNK